MSSEAEPAASVELATSAANGDADLDPIKTAVRLKAYELFLSRGERHGDDLADWLEAERVVRHELS